MQKMLLTFSLYAIFFSLLVVNPWSCPTRGVVQWTMPQGQAVEDMRAYSTSLERVNGSDGNIFLTCLVFSQTAEASTDFKYINPTAFWVDLESGKKEVTVAIIEDNVCIALKVN